MCDAEVASADPAVARDGALCCIAQLANKLAPLNPRTGSIKEFPRETSDSGHHGLAADKNGNI
jgi:virginiamycin B lyase